MKQLSLFALLQFLTAGTATALIAWGYLNYHEPLQKALVELDAMAQTTDSQLEMATVLIADVDQVAEGFQTAIPKHRKTIAAARDLSLTLQDTFTQWEEDLPEYQEIVDDMSEFTEDVSGHLPLPIPRVGIVNREFQLPLPHFTPGTQQVRLPYPTAEVKTTSKSIKYPQQATVNIAEFRQTLRVLNQDFGELKFQYPSKLTVKTASADLNYPSSISIGTQWKNITVPAPKMSLRNQAVTLPVAAQVGTLHLLEKEKEFLDDSTSGLKDLHAGLGTTQASIAKMRSYLENEVADSLVDADLSLKDAEDSLQTLRGEHVPRALEDLQAHRENLHESRQIFTAISGLIALAFAIAGLITLALTLNGFLRIFPPVLRPVTENRTL